MHRMRRRYSGAYTITAITYDADGVEATATSGTVSVYDSAGTAIVTDGLCSVVDGDLTYDLDADEIPNLDTYDCRWKPTVAGVEYELRTSFELVGDYLFEISDLRAHDDGTFASTTDYPTATLQDARVWVEQRIEHASGVSFFNRGARETYRGKGTPYMALMQPRIAEVYSIVEDGLAWTADEIAALHIQGGHLYREFDVWDKDAEFVIHYRHGHDDTPAPIKQAGLILAAEYLIASNLRSRATSESTDVGFIRLAVAREGGKVGIPEVDAVIGDYRERTVRIG